MQPRLFRSEEDKLRAQILSTIIGRDKFQLAADSKLAEIKKLILNQDLQLLKSFDDREVTA